MQIETSESFTWLKFLLVLVFIVMIVSGVAVLASSGRLTLGADPERQARADAIRMMAPIATQQALDQAAQLHALAVLSKEADVAAKQDTKAYYHDVRIATMILGVVGAGLGMALALVGVGAWSVWRVKLAAMPAVKVIGEGLVVVQHDGGHILIDEYTGARARLSDGAAVDLIRANIMIRKQSNEGDSNDGRFYLVGPESQQAYTEQGAGSDSLRSGEVWREAGGDTLE